MHYFYGKVAEIIEIQYEVCYTQHIVCIYKIGGETKTCNHSKSSS
jgi:hypothetical protein